MNIIFIAAPAAGKGTQAGLLKCEFGLYHLSTGDVLREIASTDTSRKYHCLHSNHIVFPSV